MTPELVIFDCDGVLVDSERMEVGTIAEALTWVDSGLDAATIHDRQAGGNLATLIAVIEADIGRSVPDWFLDRYRALQFERLGSVEPVPGARDAVAAVTDAGLPRCIVSGGPIRKMEISLGATALWDSFAPHIFSCYEIDDYKPSPGIYLHALGVFGVAATECVAIEDSANGVAAAAAAGVPVVGLARDSDAARLIAAGATTTIGHMSEFGAHLGLVD